MLVKSGNAHRFSFIHSYYVLCFSLLVAGEAGRDGTVDEGNVSQVQLMVDLICLAQFTVKSPSFILAKYTG